MVAGLPNVLYPFLVDLHRSRLSSPTNSVGGEGYSGREASISFTDPEGEVVLMTGIPCQIQGKGIGRATGTMLIAGDIVKHPQWIIITDPSLNLPSGTIRDRDILVDNNGYRYGVALNTWTLLGYNLDCIRLET